MFWMFDCQGTSLWSSRKALIRRKSRMRRKMRTLRTTQNLADLKLQGKVRVNCVVNKARPGVLPEKHWKTAFSWNFTNKRRMEKLWGPFEKCLRPWLLEMKRIQSNLINTGWNWSRTNHWLLISWQVSDTENSWKFIPWPKGWYGS